MGCRSIAYYNITWFLKSIMLIPMMIYHLCSTLSESFSNPILKWCAIPLFILLLIWLSESCIILFYVDKRRIKIYNGIVEKTIDYNEGIVSAEKLLKLPISRVSCLEVLFLLASIELRRLDFEKAKERYKKLQEVNEYYKGGVYFALICDYYFLLISIYENNDVHMSVDRFLNKYNEVNNQYLIPFVNTVIHFSERNYELFVNDICKQNKNNDFLEELIKKYS